MTLIFTLVFRRGTSFARGPWRCTVLYCTCTVHWKRVKIEVQGERLVSTDCRRRRSSCARKVARLTRCCSDGGGSGGGGGRGNGGRGGADCGGVGGVSAPPPQALMLVAPPRASLARAALATAGQKESKWCMRTYVRCAFPAVPPFLVLSGRHSPPPTQEHRVPALWRQSRVVQRVWGCRGGRCADDAHQRWGVVMEVGRGKKGSPLARMG